MANDYFRTIGKAVIAYEPARCLEPLCAVLASEQIPESVLPERLAVNVIRRQTGLQGIIRGKARKVRDGCTRAAPDNSAGL